MELIDNINEFIFVPKNKTSKSEGWNIDNLINTKAKTISAENKLKNKAEYLPSIKNIKSGINIRYTKREYNALESNDVYKSQIPHLSYLVSDSTKTPFVLSKSNSIKISNDLVKIDNISIKIEDIVALRWEKPSGGGPFDRSYTFELKAVNENIICFTCTVTDGNGFWLGPDSNLYKDSFSEIWPRLIHRLQKQTVAFIILPIITQIESGDDYSFGIRRSGDKEEFSYLTVNKRGAYLSVDAIFTFKRILVPWSQLSYEISSDDVRIYHKLKIANHKYLCNSEWNIFLLPVLIDYMKKVIST